MTKKIPSIKAEFLPGGAKRQELLDSVPKYLQTPGFQGDKHSILFGRLEAHRD
jgi:hypothetical protein